MDSLTQAAREGSQKCMALLLDYLSNLETFADATDEGVAMVRREGETLIRTAYLKHAPADAEECARRIGPLHRDVTWIDEAQALIQAHTAKVHEGLVGASRLALEVLTNYYGEDEGGEEGATMPEVAVYALRAALKGAPDEK